MIYQGFCGPSYVSQSPLASGEECINLYPEALEVAHGRNDYTLYPTPGYSTYCTGDTNRGSSGADIFGQNGRCFAVVRGGFHEITFSTATIGATTFRGAVASDSNPATICSNGDGGHQLFITSGGACYLFDLTANSFRRLTDSNGGYLVASHGAFLDGYFLALDTTTSTLLISDLNDGATWDVTQVAQRTAGGDRWLAMAVVNRLIWLWGERTSEVWYNAGTSPFPLAPIQEAFTEIGIANAFAFAKSDQSVRWIGASDDGHAVVLEAQGYAATRISTFAVENSLGESGLPSNQGTGTGTSVPAGLSGITAFSYLDRGHSFSVFNCPQIGISWVYDGATKLWHKRGHFNPLTGRYDALKVEAHAFVFGLHLLAGRDSLNVYRQDIGLFLDIGSTTLRRLRRPPILCAEQQRLRIARLTVDLEPAIDEAVGRFAQSGDDEIVQTPYLMGRFSWDGGKTFGNERSVSAGALGKYGTRVRFLRLGSGRQFQPEFTMTSRMPWRLLNCYVEAA